MALTLILVLSLSGSFGETLCVVNGPDKTELKTSPTSDGMLHIK